MGDEARFDHAAAGPVAAPSGFRHIRSGGTGCRGRSNSQKPVEPEVRLRRNGLRRGAWMTGWPAKSRLPRRIGACLLAVFRCRFRDSTAPFSRAAPRSLRLASMPRWPANASPGDVLALVGGQIAESRREAVGAVILRCSAERPEGLLHVPGQGREAFPPRATPTGPHRHVPGGCKPLRSGKAGAGTAGDRRFRFAGMGDVGPGQVSRLRRLAEDDVALGTLQRPPLPHTPLRDAPETIVGKRHRAETLKVAQQSNRLQRTAIPKQGEEVVLPAASRGSDILRR